YIITSKTVGSPTVPTHATGLAQSRGFRCGIESRCMAFETLRASGLFLPLVSLGAAKLEQPSADQEVPSYLWRALTGDLVPPGQQKAAPAWPHLEKRAAKTDHLHEGSRTPYICSLCRTETRAIAPGPLRAWVPWANPPFSM